MRPARMRNLRVATPGSGGEEHPDMAQGLRHRIHQHVPAAGIAWASRLVSTFISVPSGRRQLSISSGDDGAENQACVRLCSRRRTPRPDKASRFDPVAPRPKRSDRLLCSPRDKHKHMTRIARTVRPDPGSACIAKFSLMDPGRPVTSRRRLCGGWATPGFPWRAGTSLNVWRARAKGSGLCLALSALALTLALCAGGCDCQRHFQVFAGRADAHA